MVLLAGVAGTSVGVVQAHETDPSIVIELREVRPELPAGVTIQVVTSVAAQLVAENTTEEELVVLAEGGEPFLRIGPEGVLANLASPDWYRTNDPSGAAPVPERARTPGAPPEWARVSAEPSWGWFDHRLHDRDRTAAPTVGTADVLATWQVPVRYGGVDALVSGEVVHRPVRGAVVAALRDEGRVAEGLELTVLPGPFPGLFLASDRTDVVTVRGAHGEPFLRLGPDGAEVNVRSPVWADNAAARGEVPPDQVDPTAPPEWLSLTGDRRVSWLEPRARPEADPPAEVTDGGRVVELARWEVPIEVAGEVVVARGVTRWEPLSAGGAAAGAPVLPRVLGGVGVLLLVVLAGLRARRRRGRPTG